jgi:hypothetical protein
MAVYNTVVSSVDDWVDLNTLSGAAVGAAIVIQNISSCNAYVVDSATKPTRTDGPVIYTSDRGQLSIAEVAAGSLKIWVRPAEQSKTIRLVVSD